MNKDLVRIIENPVIFQNLCTMRDKRTDSQGVRLATRKITRVLLYEAAKNLPLVEKENYIGTVGKNMLDKMFQGSLAKFASSLYDGEKLSSKEVKQLQEFIDRQK